MESTSRDNDMEFDDFFVVTLFLKKGHFGDIYRCYSKETGDEFAVKILSNHSYSKDDQDEIVPLRFSREAAIWRRLKHRNIVEMFRIFKTPCEQYLVMEYIKDGNLLDQIVNFTTYTERDACHFMKQLFETLAYLREKRVIHRDIKTDNLLVKKSHYGEILKLSDFGLAIRLDKGKCSTDIEPNGVPLHLAPETILEKPVGYSVDLWSLGVIMYTLLSGYPPFFNERPEELYAEIITKNVKLTSPIWDNVSENAKDLIRGLLRKNPQKRLTAAEALNHPWITNEIPKLHRKQTITKLKEFNARRKLKGAIFTVQTLYRMKESSSSKRSSHSAIPSHNNKAESHLYKINENSRRKSAAIIGKANYKDLSNDRKLSEVNIIFNPRAIQVDFRGVPV